jgi:hypothetical protein
MSKYTNLSHVGIRIKTRAIVGIAWERRAVGRVMVWIRQGVAPRTPPTRIQRVKTRIGMRHCERHCRGMKASGMDRTVDSLALYIFTGTETMCVQRRTEIQFGSFPCASRHASRELGRDTHVRSPGQTMASNFAAKSSKLEPHIQSRFGFNGGPSY